MTAPGLRWPSQAWVDSAKTPENPWQVFWWRAIGQTGIFEFVSAPTLTEILYVHLCFAEGQIA